MNIERMIKVRDRLNDKINAKLHDFLVKLHEAGEFAPTVTKKFGGGVDTINEIRVKGDELVLICENYFRDNAHKYTLYFLLDLVDNPNVEEIKKYSEAKKQQKLKEDLIKFQRVVKEKEEAEKQQELQTLARLKAKYPEK